MNILITGANGFIGAHFAQYCLKHGLSVIATGTKASANCRPANFTYVMMDITNPSQVEQIFQLYQPSVIVHAAAMSKPDICNLQKLECLQTNVIGTQVLLNAVSKFVPSAHFIYLSSDFVFGGNGPNKEDAVKEPLNFYGASKLMAEFCVSQSPLSYTIVRPSFVFGPVLEGIRSDFLHGVLHKINAGELVSIVNDQYRTPTFVIDFCKGLHQIIIQKSTGVFHIAGNAYITPYQLVLMMAKYLKLPIHFIQAVTEVDFHEPVKRAKNGGLNIEKAQKFLGYQCTDIETAIQLSFNANC
ncbi:MAG: SDR family oxidoreductase [Bacteroidota bacterium]|jgi:dTDP-4-dehydrorhamnose reductase|nr:SDR family oxidoreductase [Bacteroidota bacterium]